MENSFYTPNNRDNRPSEQYPYQQNRCSNLGLILGIVAVAIIIVGICGWWYFSKYSAEPLVTEDSYIETTSDAQLSVESSPTDNSTTTTSIENDPSNVNAVAKPATLPLVNSPLAYRGTVTPGGSATLNITFFNNGRLEGSLNYSNGKNMPLFGSYELTDENHIVNLKFTVCSESDKTYSESWAGGSTYLTEDLDHSLIFKQIYTSTGQSKTATFTFRL